MKVYDKNYMRRELRKPLKHAVVVADGYFGRAKEGMKKVQFKTPYSQLAIKKGRRAGQGVATLSKAKYSYNKKQKALRARVEGTHSLNIPFSL